MGAIQQAPAEALETDPLGRNSSQQTAAVYYNGVFAVANDERRLRTSMTAQVFIITERAQGVVRVPMAALGEALDEGITRSRCWKASRPWYAECVSVPAIVAMPKCWKG